MKVSELRAMLDTFDDSDIVIISDNTRTGYHKALQIHSAAASRETEGNYLVLSAGEIVEDVYAEEAYCHDHETFNCRKCE